MLPELKIYITIGIGDIIQIKGELEAVKHKFSKIIICPHLGLTPETKGKAPEFDQCVKDLCIRLFSASPFKLDFEAYKKAEKDCLHQYETYRKEYGIYRIHPRLNKFLCETRYEINLDNYVILNTKIRGYTEKDYKKHLNEFLDSIESMNKKYKVVLLGEREVRLTKEYQGFKERICCIYEDIVHNLCRDNIYDFTQAKDLLLNPSIENIIKDCSIMAKANRVINIGGGGAFCMAYSVGRLSSAFNDPHEFKLFKPFIDENRFFLANNMPDFCAHLRGL